MKQINSHYQALLAPLYPAYSIDLAMDIEEVIGVLDARVTNAKKVAENLNEKFFFFITEKDDEELTESNAIGTIRFTCEDALLPTCMPDQIGVIISVKGKTFVCYYDENANMCIGFNGALYCYSDNPTWVDDYNELYWFIFEQIDPIDGDIE